MFGDSTCTTCAPISAMMLAAKGPAMFVPVMSTFTLESTPNFGN